MRSDFPVLIVDYATSSGGLSKYSIGFLGQIGKIWPKISPKKGWVFGQDPVGACPNTHCSKRGEGFWKIILIRTNLLDFWKNRPKINAQIILSWEGGEGVLGWVFGQAPSVSALKFKDEECNRGKLNRYAEKHRHMMYLFEINPSKPTAKMEIG